jgi:hypothetical protein
MCSVVQNCDQKRYQLESRERCPTELHHHIEDIPQHNITACQHNQTLT